jgi:hypothetical protein
MTYLTKEEIVDELFAALTEEDKRSLKTYYKSEDELGILHHGYGTHIRNTYKLWEAANPLTHDWFKDCAFAERDGVKHAYMIDGVDHHPQHPDQVSFDIIKAVWHKVVDV